MLLYIMLYIVLAYLMLFAALTNAVCLYNASFLPLISVNAFYFHALSLFIMPHRMIFVMACMLLRFLYNLNKPVCVVTMAINKRLYGFSINFGKWLVKNTVCFAFGSTELNPAAVEVQSAADSAEPRCLVKIGQTGKRLHNSTNTC